MVGQLINAPTSSWFQLNETFYRKEERYNLIWKKIKLNQYNIAVGKHGGLIAMARNPNQLALSHYDDNLLNGLTIFTSSGKLMNTIKWDKGTLVSFDWAERDRIVCIYSEGIVRIYSIFGEYSQFSLGLSGQQSIKEGKCCNNSLIVLTSDFQFLAVNDLDEPRIKKLGENVELKDIHSWSILEPKYDQPQQLEIYLSQDNTIFTLDDKQIMDQKLDQGPFINICISPSGSFLCLINSLSILMVVSTDFQQKFTEVQLTSSELPDQVAWCGNDLILLVYGSELEIFGPFGDSEKFYYESEIFVVTELDGARIFTDFKCEFIQKVPSSTLSIFNIGSTHPSALLFDALDHFEKESPKADETMGIIMDQLPQAVEGCLDGAGQEWEPNLQKALLRAASFGKSYIDDYDGDRFSNLCQMHRILNQIRMFDVGISLTMTQLNTFTVDKLIKRLLEMHHHFLALKICQYLHLKSDEVLIHWACEKLRNSLEDEDTTSRIILDKIGQYPGLSYYKIAKVANQNGQLQLAINLLDREPCVHSQIPMLLDMQEDERALDKAILSGDSNLVYLVLLQLKQKLNVGEFFKLINPNLVARELFENYSKIQDIDLLKDFYYQDDRRYDLIKLKFRDTFDIKDFDEFELLWKDLLKDFKSLPTKPEECKLAEEQVKLLQYQVQLKEKAGQSVMGSSLAETIKLATKFEEHTLATKLQKEFKLNEKSYWYLRIHGFISANNYTGLEQFSKSKKSPIGYKPFYDLCVQAHQPSQAIKYALKCDADIRPKLFLKVGAYLEAAQQAFNNKDREMLKTVREQCNNPSIKQEVDTLLIKLGSN